MMLPLTGLSASLLCLLYVGLAVNVIRLRRSKGVGIEGGGDLQLRMAVRAHGNLSEYAPLALLLLAVCELNQPPNLLLVVPMALLLLGRLLHAVAFALLWQSQPPHFPLRVVGTALTLTALLSLAGTALWLVLTASGTP